MYQDLSIAAVGSSDWSKLSLGKRAHRIVRRELFNFFLRDSKLLVDLLQNMLQRCRFNAVHHFHSFLNILQNNFSLVLVGFLIQGLYNIVTKLVGQQIVKIDLLSVNDVLDHKWVIWHHWLGARVDRDADYLFQDLQLELFQLLLSLSLRLSDHLDAVLEKFAAISIYSHRLGVFLDLLEDEFPLIIIAVLKNGTKYECSILIFDKHVVFW